MQRAWKACRPNHHQPRRRPTQRPRRLPALTELSVTPRRTTGREKANLAESSATGGGPQRAPGAEPPPSSEGTGAAPLTRLSPPPTPGPEPPVPLQELRGAHGAVGSVHRAPLLLRHIARLPATGTRSVPTPVAVAAAPCRLTGRPYQPPAPPASRAPAQAKGRSTASSRRAAAMAAIPGLQLPACTAPPPPRLRRPARDTP